MKKVTNKKSVKCAYCKQDIPIQYGVIRAYGLNFCSITHRDNYSENSYQVKQ